MPVIFLKCNVTVNIDLKITQDLHYFTLVHNFFYQGDVLLYYDNAGINADPNIQSCCKENVMHIWQPNCTVGAVWLLLIMAVWCISENNFRRTFHTLISRKNVVHFKNEAAFTSSEKLQWVCEKYNCDILFRLIFLRIKNGRK